MIDLLLKHGFWDEVDRFVLYTNPRQFDYSKNLEKVWYSSQSHKATDNKVL